MIMPKNTYFPFLVWFSHTGLSEALGPCSLYSPVVLNLFFIVGLVEGAFNAHLTLKAPWSPKGGFDVHLTPLGSFDVHLSPIRDKYSNVKFQQHMYQIP